MLVESDGGKEQRKESKETFVKACKAKWTKKGEVKATLQVGWAVLQ